MKLYIEDYDLYENEELLEGNPAAALLTIKNQLMKTLGNAFKFIGGSTVPKFTMQPKDNEDVAFEITTDGNNVDCTPKIKGVNDTAHKKKGIAFMRAANVITDFVNSFLKQPAFESVDLDEYFEEDDKKYFVTLTKLIPGKRNLDDTVDDYLETDSYDEAIEQAIRWYDKYSKRNYVVHIFDRDDPTMGMEEFVPEYISIRGESKMVKRNGKRMNEDFNTETFNDFSHKVEKCRELAMTISHMLNEIDDYSRDYMIDSVDVISEFDELNFKLDQSITALKTAESKIGTVHERTTG